MSFWCPASLRNPFGWLLIYLFGLAAPLLMEGSSSVWRELLDLEKGKKSNSWFQKFENKNLSLNAYLAGGRISGKSTQPEIQFLFLGEPSRYAFEAVKEVLPLLVHFFDFKGKALPHFNPPLPGENNRRIVQDGGLTLQVKSGYLLEQVIKNFPGPSGGGTIALTHLDIFPREDWSFLFGHTDRYHRVSLLSFFRLGSFEIPSQRWQAKRRLSLLMAHEIGHLMGLTHCRDFPCLMTPVSKVGQLDQIPLRFCVPCLKKIFWGRNENLKGYFLKGYQLIKNLGFYPDLGFYQNALKLLRRVDREK